MNCLSFGEHWHITTELQTLFRHAPESVHSACYPQLLVCVTRFGFEPSTNIMLVLQLSPIKAMWEPQM